MPAPLIGIDLGGTNIKAALVTPAGRVLAHTAHPTEATKGRARVVANLIAVAGHLAAQSKLKPAALGLSIPGEADAKGRIWRLPHVPGFEKYPLAAKMAEATGIKRVVAENDAACAALAEHRLGAAKSYRNFMQVTLGTGVGGGLVLDGQLYRGRDGFAAEIGHVAVHNAGRQCACGARGCMEAYCGSDGIVQTYRELGGRVATVAEIAEHARKGERAAKEALAETGRLLGHSLASILNVLNLEAIVFSGGIRRALPHMRRALVGVLRERCMGAPVSRLPLKLTKLGDDAGAIGAALLAGCTRYGRPGSPSSFLH